MVCTNNIPETATQKQTHARTQAPTYTHTRTHRPAHTHTRMPKRVPNSAQISNKNRLDIYYFMILFTVIVPIDINLFFCPKHIHIHIDIHTYIHTYIHARIHIHIHIHHTSYTHTHIHTYTHTHKQWTGAYVVDGKHHFHVFFYHHHQCMCGVFSGWSHSNGSGGGDGVRVSVRECGWWW